MRPRRRRSGRRAALGLALAAAAWLLAAAEAPAAPAPPLGPLDLCGSIVSQAWEPARTVPATPGASGTLGRDRLFPAQFRVVLQGYSGIDGAMAARVNGYLGFAQADAGGTPARPARVLLLLPHDDPRHLDGATSLCVVGFRGHGDEGGTWTQYRDLQVKR